MLTMWKRVTALFRGRRLDQELSEEVESHLAMQEEEFRRRGLDAAAARAAALREFGGVARAQEQYRERRGVPWLESLAKDTRYTLRGLRRNPGFTAAAVLSLALGIGANTAIFSMFHRLMLRMLPVARPEELVTLYRTGGWGTGNVSYPLYLEMRQRTDLFSGVVAKEGPYKARFRASSGDRRETAQCELVTGNYFGVLGVPPAIGRLFTDDDNRTPHAHPLAVLSYDFWQRRFGGDRSVLGRTMTVERQTLTVIGVAARGFHGVEVDHNTDLWEPLMMYEDDVMEPGMNWLFLMGRRQPGVSRQQVQAAVDVLFRQYLTALYGTNGNTAFRGVAMAQQLEVREGGIGLSMLRDQFGQALAVLMAAVGLVLLAACVNVANLLLARGTARQKETAVRLALGAKRSRLVRQGLTESLLLAAGGCALGILIAIWGVDAILKFLPASSGDPFSRAPDATVLAFTLAISVGCVLLFGLAPALRSTAVNPADCIKPGGGPAGGRQPALRRALVVAQVAFSVLLAALASLFGQSLAALRSFDVGFRDQSAMAFSVNYPERWTKEEVKAARDRLVAGIEALPGVSLVGHGSPGPFLGGYSSGTVNVPGSQAMAKGPAWVNTQKVSQRYFEILGSALVAGREFDHGDTAASRKVTLVNEAFVKAYLPGEAHPLGRVVGYGKGEFTIVGVVHDIPHLGLREKIVPTLYLADAQMGSGWGVILVRYSLPRDEMARAIRREVGRLGPDVETSEPQTIRQRIDDSIFQDRLLAAVGGFFGGLALLLTGIGLYGVVAYGTARRASEIGIRMALGARRANVLWMVLRDALLLVGTGLAIGLPLTLAATHAVASMLFGVKADDWTTLGTTAALLAAIGVAAAFAPARRAAWMDPMRSLRNE